MRLFARRRWPLVEGKVIDKRHIKKFLARFDSSQFTVSVDEYMVEFPLADGSGKPGRVVIKAQSVHIPPQGISVGQTVPLHVNPKGTQAVFGHFAPVVSRAERKQREKNQRAKDENASRKNSKSAESTPSEVSPLKGRVLGIPWRRQRIPRRTATGLPRRGSATARTAPCRRASWRSSMRSRPAACR